MQHIQSEIQIRHLRTNDFEGRVNNNGGATIAYVEDGKDVVYSTAFCSPKDNFCRSVGRQAAVGRLNSDKHSRSLPMSLEEFEKELTTVGESWSEDNEDLALLLNEHIESDVPAAYIRRKDYHG